MLIIIKTTAKSTSLFNRSPSIMSSLAKKPLNGGIPAKEKKNK